MGGARDRTCGLAAATSAVPHDWRAILAHRGLPVLLLTTIGRRTGRGRTVPLLYLRDGGRLVVCNVNPGFERTNPWVLNLRAQPDARVQIRREVFDVVAREASPAELERYWPRLTTMWPAYQTFYDQGGKRSVFVLDRMPGS